MVNAKLNELALHEDREYERTAWFTSMIMSASGNYGKKGVDPSKLYKRQYDYTGKPISENTGTFTSIDKELKDNKLSELMKKFNK